jgi:hypothetical protein
MPTVNRVFSSSSKSSEFVETWENASRPPPTTKSEHNKGHRKPLAGRRTTSDHHAISVADPITTAKTDQGLVPETAYPRRRVYYADAAMFAAELRFDPAVLAVVRVAVLEA